MPTPLLILFMEVLGAAQLVRILWCCQWTQWTSFDLTVRSLNVYFEVPFLGWVCLKRLQHNLCSRFMPLMIFYWPFWPPGKFLNLQRSLFLTSKSPFRVKILLCHPAPCGTSALGPHSFWERNGILEAMSCQEMTWSYHLNWSYMFMYVNHVDSSKLCQKSPLQIGIVPPISASCHQISSGPRSCDDDINGSIQRNIYVFLGGWCYLVIYQQLYRIKVLCKAKKIRQYLYRYNNCYK